MIAKTNITGVDLGSALRRFLSASLSAQLKNETDAFSKHVNTRRLGRPSPAKRKRGLVNGASRS